MVCEATAAIPSLNPAEAKRRRENPDTLVINIRDAAEIPFTGLIPKTANISYGTLIYKADPATNPGIQSRQRRKMGPSATSKRVNTDNSG